MMSRTQRDGFLLVLLAAAGYAFLPTVTKNLYAVSDFGPTDIAVWRFLFAVPLIWLVVRSRPGPAAGPPLPRVRLLLLGIVYAFAAFAAFFGLELVDASIYVVLFYTYPAMVALIALFMGQRLQAVAWVALGMTLVGVVLTVPDVSGLESSSVLGLVVAVGNAFVVAVYYILSGRVLHGHAAIARGTAWVMTGSLLALLCLVPFDGLTPPDNMATWGNLAFLALVCTAMPIFCLNLGIQKLGAARASIVSSAEPVAAMFLAVLLLGENVGPVQWLGALLIIASVVLLQVGRLPGRSKPAAKLPGTA